MKKATKGLRKVQLRDRLILAEERGDTAAYKGVKQIIEREEAKLMWREINGSVDDTILGATYHVQREGLDGSIEDITEPEEMNAEIQYVTEQKFDLAHSGQITIFSLAAKLGYLPDTECAQQLLSGQVKMPSDMDATTTIVLDEIARLGMTIASFAGDKLVITPKKFHHY